MRSFSVLVLFATIAAALPNPRAGYVLHEKRTHEPVDWLKTGRLEADRVLPMRFGLTQSNLHKLEEMLMAVSHPESSSYGKHYTPEEVVEIFKPADETVDAVTDWLIESGISANRMRLSVNKGWIEFNATVAEAESLLDTEYHVYTHHTGVEQIGCEGYHVPKHIQEHIDLVKPTIQFHHGPPPKRNRFRKRDNVSTQLYRGPKTDGQKVKVSPTSNCSNLITPPCLNALYNIDYKPVATKKNTFGIVEFTPQAYLQSDLDLFFANFSPKAVGKSPKLVSIDGGFAQTTKQSFNDNGESDLDLEFAMTLVYPQEVLLLQTGDNVEGGSFNNWLDAVDKSYCTYDGGDSPLQDGIYPDNKTGGYDGPESCGIIPPPHVVSTSYGSDEIDVSIAYANRQCYEYGKIGMMGSTVLYSSGDDGVASGTGRCLGPLGIPTKSGTRFVPGFPADCPWVTAVGATQLPYNTSVNHAEEATFEVIFSGGGFSNYFSMPSYQASLVNTYLTKHTPPYTSAQYNNSGKARGYPDISANGANYVTAVDGEFIRVFGTSASSPVMGSIITLINDARIAAFKSPVGFINPSIYSSSFQIAFNDITKGSNPGCGTVGFNATKGWDPVTGVGTPNFEILKDLWLALP